MSDTVVRYGTSGSGRELSPALWRRCPRGAILSGHLDKGWGFIDDFGDCEAHATDAAVTIGAWTVDNATAGTAVIADRAGGWVILDSASSTADQGVQIQRLRDTGGEQFIASAASEIFFEARIEVTDIGGLTGGNGAQFFIGLGERDATFMASGVCSASNYLGFCYDANDTSATWKFNGEKVDVEDTNDTGVAIVDDATTDTRYRLGFHIKGVTEAIPYVNGVAYPAAKLPTAAVPIVLMAPTLVCQSEGTVDPIMNVDYVACFQVENYNA